jgi:crotonobetainyl-CoA:carnitine CoA-transferase CaiB-like acyl-CoA transferase
MAEVAYEVYNRNKRSMTINLRSEIGRNISCKLVESADVIVEGFRPGVMKRLGIDYDAIKELNPRIVYCSMSGFGQDGPYADLPGHDVNYISIAGLLSMIGVRRGPPVIPMNFLADWAGAADSAVMGILIAIIARQKDDLGQYVDISYLDASMDLLVLWSTITLISERPIIEEKPHLKTASTSASAVLNHISGRIFAAF